MRKPWLAAAVLLAILAPTAAASRPRPRLATVEYTPPAEPGSIFTVIDFPHPGGTAEPITISEAMGPRHRSFTAVSRYLCSHSTPNGVVVRFRHMSAEPTPFTLTTSGIIVRGPFQEELPPEALHHCYQLVS